MQIKKGDLVNGAYSIIRISGLTINPQPDQVSAGVQEADDLASELKGMGVDINWQQPTNYGLSDTDDTSGLTAEMAGAFKSLLALRLIDLFGKQATPTLVDRSNKGMRTLEQIVIHVPETELPSTLPTGSGNEWGRNDRHFYPEPAANQDADYVFKGDVLNYTEDFSAWLIDEELASVSWEVSGSGITIENETFDETTASAQLTFTRIGGYTVCITATKTNSTDVLTANKNFIINNCERKTNVFI